MSPGLESAGGKCTQLWPAISMLALPSPQMSTGIDLAPGLGNFASRIGINTMNQEQKANSAAQCSLTSLENPI
jgi:hypothetical protein